MILMTRMFPAVDSIADPGFICAMYFHSQYPCYGGVLALDGKTGQIVWQHWTEEAVFAVDCSADLTGDDINDCLATGKKGVRSIRILSFYTHANTFYIVF